MFLLHIWNAVMTAVWYYLLRRRLRYVLDKQSPEILASFFLAGVFSVGLSMGLHGLWPTEWISWYARDNELLYQILVTGLVEETAKFLAFLLVAHSFVTVKEPQDGVLQGAAVGLGFAIIENISYIQAYPEAAIALRPLLATPGHMIYGAIWGGFYSIARWSNVRGRDERSYALAIAGVLGVALVHGFYNAMVGYGYLVGIMVDGVTLWAAYRLFLHLVERSPYRTYPLSQAAAASRAIERGLRFNLTSPILNRRLGIYLMHLGQYRGAAEHFSRALPRFHDRESLQFFQAVCELRHVPAVHAGPRLRRSWAAVPEERQGRLLSQLKQILSEDPLLLQEFRRVIQEAPARRSPAETHELARQLKLKRSARQQAERRVRGLKHRG